MNTDYFERLQDHMEARWELQQSEFNLMADDRLMDNLETVDPVWLYVAACASPRFCALMGLPDEVNALALKQLRDPDSEAYRELNAWREDTIGGIEI